MSVLRVDRVQDVQTVGRARRCAGHRDGEEAWEGRAHRRPPGPAGAGLVEPEPRLLQPPEGADSVRVTIRARAAWRKNRKARRNRGAGSGPLAASPRALPELACAPPSLVARFLRVLRS